MTEAVSLYRKVRTPQSGVSALSLKSIILSEIAGSGVSYEEIRGSHRVEEIRKMRWRCIARIRQLRPDAGYSQIGRAINKDHATVIHALKKMGMR